MKELNKKFKSIKKSHDINQINDFLIDLSSNPNSEYLEFIDYFIDKANKEVFNQIKINLIYLIGEIGKNIRLESKYFDFLVREYFSSDRWIRNEILMAFNKMANHAKFPDSILEVLKFALIDDYAPLNINALNILIYFEQIPNYLIKTIFRLLKISDSKLNEQIEIVLLKFIKDINQLYNLLNDLGNYQTLNKKAIRSLLGIFFKNISSLEDLTLFKDLILNSNWEIQNKESFKNEIEIYEKLLLKTY